jgi:hypothetical protein
VRNCDNILRLETGSLKGFYEGVRMPGQTLISPIHSHRRGENTMTAVFELLFQKLPAFRPLAAAVY